MYIPEELGQGTLTFLLCSQGGHPGRARRSRAFQGLQIAFGDVELIPPFHQSVLGLASLGTGRGRRGLLFVTLSPKSFSGACLEAAWGGRLPGREEGGRGLLQTSPHQSYCFE